MSFGICPPISNGHVIVVCCILYARLRGLLSELEWSRSFCKMTREISSLIMEVESVEWFPNGFNLFLKLWILINFSSKKTVWPVPVSLKTVANSNVPWTRKSHDTAMGNSMPDHVIWPIRLILLGSLLNQSILEQSPNESWAARSRFKQWSLLLSLGM